MSNEVRRKPTMTKADPYKDIKSLFCVIISLLFIKNLKKQKTYYSDELMCATTKREA